MTKPPTIPSSDDAGLELLDSLVSAAKAAGADGVEAMSAVGTELAVTYRLGRLEQIEHAEHHHLGLVVISGKRQAMVSGAAAPDPRSLVERAMAMVRTLPDDPYCGLADKVLLAHAFPDVDSEDPSEPDTGILSELASQVEQAAREVVGITNTDGCKSGWLRSSFTIVSSNGFVGTRKCSRWELSATAVSGSGSAMECDWEASSAVYRQDLMTPSEVGRCAGERAVRRLGARRITSCSVPIVYDSRVSRSLLKHLAEAINGRAIASGNSFLGRGDLGRAILSPGIQIVDDPTIKRGLRSRAFDDQGLPLQPLTVVDRGTLQHCLLDLHSARQLGLSSNGRAVRTTSSLPLPAPSNLSMLSGTRSPQELIGEMDSGLLVTELIGQGVNLVTGDYSRGAAGFWIENGEIAFPVSEVTISGNLGQMFTRLESADDLERRFGIDAPSVRVDGMAVAGS